MRAPKFFRWVPAAVPRVRRHLAALLVAAAALAGVVVISLEDGFAVNSFQLGSGDVWVASSGPGQLALLDGSSAEVAVRLAVAPAGSDLIAVQGSTTGYAVNRTAGSIVRVDAIKWTTSKAIQLIKDSSLGLSAIATDQAVYAVDGLRGLVQEADPMTLEARGGPRSLSAEPAPGSPVVDNRGVMWLLDTRIGDLIRVSGQVDRTTKGIATSAAARLVLADGRPVVVDPAAGKVLPIDSSGEPESETCIDTNPVDTSVRIGGGTSSSAIYAVSGADGVLRITDLTTGRCDAVVPGIAAPNSALGIPVEVGRHVFIPDYTSGRVVVVDLDTLGLATTEQIITPGAEFELLARDGFVFYNERLSAEAGVVRIDGSVSAIAKYDVADPGKGLHIPEPEPEPVDLAAAAEQVPSNDPTTPAAQTPTPPVSPPDLATLPTRTQPPRPDNQNPAGVPNSGNGGGGGAGGGGNTAGGSNGGRNGGGGGAGGAAGTTAPATPSATPTAVPPVTDPGSPPVTPPDPPITPPDPPITPPDISPPISQHVDSADDLTISIPADALVGDPVNVNVTTKAGSGITSAEWSFGEGGATGVAATHTWSAPGTYNILVTVTRVSGNQEVGGGTIVISDAPDTTAPWFDEPLPPITRTVPFGNNAVLVNYPLPTAHDDVDPNPDVSCDPPSGSTFFVGPPLWVSCSAVDDSGNTGTSGFSVQVIEEPDPDPPIFSPCPDLTDIVPYNQTHTTVSYSCTATDNAGNPTVSCSPGSGASFALGDTVVGCTATDATGNSASTSFHVWIEAADPPEPPCLDPPLRRPLLQFGALPLCPSPP